ncbi:GIY-YIG nuclease family protein [Streptomyces virginiae]|uniref:GIY-YIG nuclease family protein n=1 Tax=Streptomyces virginiae TaxID=1961 RepID=UPI00367D1DC4
MAKPPEPERTALFDLYDTSESEGLPPFIAELYPMFLPTLHYLGSADSCPNGGPGLSYGHWALEEWSPEQVRVVEWGTPQTPVPTALYRLRDRSGALLYVGITSNLGRRWNTHADGKRWWADVATRSIEWFPTREHALAAEVQAIRAEQPRYNVQHNKRAV